MGTGCDSYPPHSSSSSMSTIDSLASEASRGVSLLQSIATLEQEVIPPPLSQEPYIAELKSQLASLKAYRMEVSQERRDQRTHLGHLRDSTAKKLAYRLTGKTDVLADKVSKEER